MERGALGVHRTEMTHVSGGFTLNMCPEWSAEVSCRACASTTQKQMEKENHRVLKKDIGALPGLFMPTECADLL